MYVDKNPFVKFWRKHGYTVIPTCLEDIDLDYEDEQKAIKEGVWVMSMRHDEARKIIEQIRTEYEIEKAEAQMLGWKHAKTGGDLFTLVKAMGLTLGEWRELKSRYTISYLTDDDKKDIDNFFCEPKKCDLCKGSKVFDGEHCICTGKRGRKGLI